MKLTLILIASVTMYISVNAQDTTSTKNNSKMNWKNKYCVALTNGKLTITNNGIPVTSDITLANGIKITMDGTVVNTDGSRRALTNGECVDKNGNIELKKN
jgi:hypothetical protein